MGRRVAKAQLPRSRVVIDKPVRRISQVRKVDQPSRGTWTLDEYSARHSGPKTRTSKSGRYRWCPFCDTALRPQPFACDECNPKWKKLRREVYIEAQKNLTAEQRVARRFTDVAQAASDIAKQTREGKVTAAAAERFRRELDRADRAAAELPRTHPVRVAGSIKRSRSQRR